MKTDPALDTVYCTIDFCRLPGTNPDDSSICVNLILSIPRSCLQTVKLYNVAVYNIILTDALTYSEFTLYRNAIVSEKPAAQKSIAVSKNLDAVAEPHPVASPMDSL